MHHQELNSYVSSKKLKHVSCCSKAKFISALILGFKQDYMNSGVVIGDPARYEN
jgi:hypothetical protein